MRPPGPAMPTVFFFSSSFLAFSVAVSELQVYGSDDARATALRAFSGGKLAMDDSPVGPLLPRNVGLLPNANDAHVYPDKDLFLAGGVLTLCPAPWLCLGERSARLGGGGEGRERGCAVVKSRSSGWAGCD
jgi:hypothetical protein